MKLEKARGEYTVCRIPGIVLTDCGTLIAYYECRKSSLSDWADIDIKVIRSTDKGETWKTSLKINGGDNTLNNPIMISSGAKLHFLFCKNYKQLYYPCSTDDGKTFSEPEEISEVFENGGFFYNAVAVGPGHGIVYGNRLIVPVWFAYNKDNAKAHSPSFIRTLYSDDDGQSWHLGEVIGKDTLINPSECALAVSADNKLMLSIRNEDPEHMRAVSFSDTGIDSWSLPYLERALEDPVCQGSMDHDGKKIFHINCSSSTSRENLTVKISGDCFKTHEEIFISEKGGYSDIAADRSYIYVIYESDIASESGGLYFKKLPI